VIGRGRVGAYFHLTQDRNISANNVILVAHGIIDRPKDHPTTELTRASPRLSGSLESVTLLCPNDLNHVENKISNHYRDHTQASTSLRCDYTSCPATVSALNNRNRPIHDTHRDCTLIERCELRVGSLLVDFPLRVRMGGTVVLGPKQV
jgi:hypothetical protein